MIRMYSAGLENSDQDGFKFSTIQRRCLCSCLYMGLLMVMPWLSLYGRLSKHRILVSASCVMPPFHQGLFGLIWTRLSPTNQSFNLPDGRPESPPIAQLF